MSIRKILSMVIVVCLLATQVATVALAEELPVQTLETIAESAEQVETKAETEAVAEVTAEEKEEENREPEAAKAEEAGASADIILMAELDDVIVTLKADKDAFENNGELSLVVKPVEIEDTEEEAALDAVEKENVAKRVTYDITVLDGETPIEPVKEVKVSFELKDAPSGADGVNIYHHDEEEGIEKIATQVLKDDASEETAKVGEAKVDTVEKDNEIKEVSEEELADTDDVAIIDDVTVDGFSLYTVDFTYKDKTISIAGDSTGNKLDDIVSQLGIKEEVTEATAYQDEECTEEADNNEVKSSDGETLYSVYEEGDTWYVDAVNAFQTEHGLVIKTADGAEYRIRVTDDATPNYLTFTSKEDGSKVKFGFIEGSNMKYSTDGGSSWTDFDVGHLPNLTLDEGKTVIFKGKQVKTNTYCHFEITGKVEASGDVTSLANESGGDVSLTSNDYWGYMFYNCTGLTKAPNLPSTVLYGDCYKYMFCGCTNLTTTPTLPAETLTYMCYANMFQDCKSLTAAPSISGTVMADSCCYSMFSGCEKLTTAPVLLATALAGGCYSYMFSGCEKLTTAPALPATTLANSCYANMFENCKSLTVAPSISATVLEEYCCDSMFSGCEKLTTAPALLATTLEKYCYENMFKDCKSLTVAPSISATVLAYRCCDSMFSGCEKLTTAPVLLATTLAGSCYAMMFYECTSLTTAPALPATTLADDCYSYMFYGCTNLTTAPALPATTLAEYCYENMFNGCTNLTTAPALQATTLKDCCYRYMFSGCTSLNVYKAEQGGLGIILDTNGISGDLSTDTEDMFDGVNKNGFSESTPASASKYYAKVVLPPVTPDTPSVPSSSGGSSSASYTQGWRQSGTNWQYVKSNGAYAKNEWLQIDGKWYHFGNDTMMTKGWFLDTDGSWYYLIKEEGQNEGKMYTGWLTDPYDGYRYYLDPATGKMLTGWHVVDGKRYYFNEVVPAPSGWTQNANGDWVYEKRNIIPLGAMK